MRNFPLAWTADSSGEIEAKLRLWCCGEWAEFSVGKLGNFLHFSGLVQHFFLNQLF